MSYENNQSQGQYEVDVKEEINTDIQKFNNEEQNIIDNEGEEYNSYEVEEIANNVEEREEVMKYNPEENEQYNGEDVGERGNIIQKMEKKKGK